MIDPAVLRECRAKFESLPDAVDRLFYAFWEDGHWMLVDQVDQPRRPEDKAERAALRDRFQLFATNFGVRVLGAVQERACEACLDQIKDRLPRYFIDSSGETYSQALQDIPFAQIDPPRPGQLGPIPQNQTGRGAPGESVRRCGLGGRRDAP